MSLSTPRLPWLILVVAVAAGFGLWLGQRVFAPSTPAAAELASMLRYPQPKAVPPFVLARADGSPLANEALQGRWTLAFFGFTHCPDVCPTTLAVFGQIEAQAKADPSAPPIALWFISVDPARDTPQVLGDYARYFSPAIVAATGTEAALAALAPALGIVYARSPLPAGGYTVDHSAQIVVFDPQGRLAAIVRPPHDAAAILADLKSLAAP
jgi:protein SCO1/2